MSDATTVRPDQVFVQHDPFGLNFKSDRGYGDGLSDEQFAGLIQMGGGLLGVALWGTAAYFAFMAGPIGWAIVGGFCVFFAGSCLISVLMGLGHVISG